MVFEVPVWLNNIDNILITLEGRKWFDKLPVLY